MSELLGHWPVKAVIIILVAFGVTRLLAAASHGAPPGREGWRRITPGPSAWFVLALGGGLFSVMTYVRLFVGSARADAERQMFILTLLILVLAACLMHTIVAMVRIRRSAIEWRGRSIRFRRADGSHALRDFADIEGVERVGQSTWRLHFAPRTTVEFSEHASGAGELIETLLASGIFVPVDPEAMGSS